MVENDLKKLILNVIGLYLDELDDNRIAVDQEFLDDLGATLELEGLKQGLDPALAARLRELTGDEVAEELGLAKPEWSRRAVRVRRAVQVVGVH